VRVRDEWTQIGNGEGIIRYRKRPVFADRHHELAAWGELLHAVVLPVRDIDVALVVEGDAPRLVELPLAAAVPASMGQRLAVGGEDLQAVVAAVDDNHVAERVAHASTQLRDISSFFRGNLADVAEVQKLAALPETTDELCAVARRLDVPES